MHSSHQRQNRRRLIDRLTSAIKPSHARHRRQHDHSPRIDGEPGPLSAIPQPEFSQEEQSEQKEGDLNTNSETPEAQKEEATDEPVSPRPPSVPVKQRVEEIEVREQAHKAKSNPQLRSSPAASPAAKPALRPQSQLSAARAPPRSEDTISTAALHQAAAQSKKQAGPDEDDVSPPIAPSSSQKPRPKSAPVAKPVTITTQTTTVSTTTTTTTMAPIALGDKVWHPRSAWAAESFETIVSASLELVNRLVLWVWGLYCFVLGVLLSKLLKPHRAQRLSKLFVAAFVYFAALPTWLTFWMVLAGRSLRHPIAAIGTGVHISTSALHLLKAGTLRKVGRGILNKATATFNKGVENFDENLSRWNRASGSEVQS